ncbi:hypothetical protein IKW73_03490 [Candidatus Saccharibacteria bacterium]|nr:hypothetical protein [Candidatus Saccharibacteria bacterium]
MSRLFTPINPATGTPVTAASGSTPAPAATPAPAPAATPAPATAATPAPAPAATPAPAPAATPAPAPAATPAKKNEILERLKNLEKEIADTKAENNALKKKVEELEGGPTDWAIANGLVPPTSDPILKENGYEFQVMDTKTGKTRQVACFSEEEAKELAKVIRLPMPEPGPVWVDSELYDGLYSVSSDLTFEQYVELQKAKKAKKS